MDLRQVRSTNRIRRIRHSKLLQRYRQHIRRDSQFSTSQHSNDAEDFYIMLPSDGAEPPEPIQHPIDMLAEALHHVQERIGYRHRTRSSKIPSLFRERRLILCQMLHLDDLMPIRLDSLKIKSLISHALLAIPDVLLRQCIVDQKRSRYNTKSRRRIMEFAQDIDIMIISVVMFRPRPEAWGGALAAQDCLDDQYEQYEDFSHPRPQSFDEDEFDKDMWVQFSGGREQ